MNLAGENSPNFVSIPRLNYYLNLTQISMFTKFAVCFFIKIYELVIFTSKMCEILFLYNHIKKFPLKTKTVSLNLTCNVSCFIAAADFR